MAKAKTTKETKSTTVRDINNVTIAFDGTVSLINYQSDGVVDFSVAINQAYGDNKTFTHYVKCKWFNPTLELEKDDVVSIRAVFGTESYDGKDGKKKYKLFVNVESLEVFD